MNDPIATAFLDALAEGETDGTPGEGYNWLFGATRHTSSSRFVGYNAFPSWAGVRGSWGITHAAGRYQFQPGTWREVADKLDLADFSPPNQDAAAWDLAQSVYKRISKRELRDDLASSKFDWVAGTLRSTWTSLSPQTFPTRFKMALEQQPAEPEPAEPEPAEPEPAEDVVIDNVLIDSLIRALQAALALDGLYDGPLDADPGPKTIQAIQDYRAQK